MAVYRADQITAALIMEEFPSVAAELQHTPEITADYLRENHADVVAQIEEGARTNVDEDAIATAERERVTAIMALSRPGAEAIIDAAIADTSMTVDNVKVQLFDHENENRQSTADAHRADGESLAASVQEIGKEGAHDNSDEKSAAEKAHEKIMAKLDKGEK